jgi:hypothetical protein
MKVRYTNKSLAMAGLLVVLIAPRQLDSKTPINAGRPYPSADIPIIKNSKVPLRGELTLELREELSIGNDKNDQEAFYRNIHFTVDDSGNFFVLDPGNDRLQKFDHNGRYLQTIGGPGQGPGDLDKPRSVSLAKDGTLYVYQPSGRLSMFDPKGIFLKLINFSHSSGLIVPLGNSCFLGTVSDYTPQASRDQVILFDSKGRKVRTIAVFENRYLLSFVGNEVVGEYQPFRPHLWCCGITDELGAYAFSGEYRIHVVDSSGETVRIIEKAEEPEKITEEEKDGTIDNEIGLRRQKGLSLTRSEVKKAFLFPENKPFFMGMFSDDRARIYVLKSGNYRKDKVLNYDLFDARGRYILRVRISIANRILPLFIRDSVLYALAVDEEGIFMAKRFRIMNWGQLDF